MIIANINKTKILIQFYQGVANHISLFFQQFLRECMFISEEEDGILGTTFSCTLRKPQTAPNASNKQLNLVNSHGVGKKAVKPTSKLCPC